MPALLIHGGRLVDPSQGLDGRFDLLVEDGVVSRLAERIDAPGVPALDAAGLVVTPGLIDMHVHLREPGQEHNETVRSGTLAAAAGGFTAVACMANTVPANDSPEITAHIIAEARRHGFARVYPIAAVTRGLAGAELSDFDALVRAGAVGFSDDGRPVMNAGLMRRALTAARRLGVPVIQHAEDLDLSGEGVMHEGEISARLGLAGIPGAAEDVMVARDLLLAEDYGGRYHVAHLSTARSLDLVRWARSRGLRASCEVTPHHLLLTDDEVARTKVSTCCKMKPPLRTEEDRAALVAGLADGSIDVIASDHAPHHADEKALGFNAAPFGILGLETTLSLCLDRLVHRGIIGLSRLVELLSTGPARVLGLPLGTLRPGSPADLTLFDLDAEITILPDGFRSLSRNTPFTGWTLRGRPVATVVAGRRVALPGAASA